MIVIVLPLIFFQIFFLNINYPVHSFIIHYIGRHKGHSEHALLPTILHWYVWLSPALVQQPNLGTVPAGKSDMVRSIISHLPLNIFLHIYLTYLFPFFPPSPPPPLLTHALAVNASILAVTIEFTGRSLIKTIPACVVWAH